ncbi:hypothetical protein PC116_g12196 [Phytophthora cactorum]|uniref:Uncharacterized protein n=2 Tax=Phytophthora cactorum TaxID=29920 RepID=A0A329SIQ0_9STRA|nr:hypothetical protein PC112_g10413 [Phytophthora cactorum]KAG2863870.1 hypothetical protein PC113_g5057 [Phytophthora cactorum]KAG2890938.1 hypothetical protein PC114_g17211 [Phytophthora cactorum]KAG2920336.1 hypothetical protein PC117_g16510 [Phytophthora cactorum]KAG3081475.1 hypothetical protein PC122_g11330 [Phytophthora cactorum]
MHGVTKKVGMTLGICFGIMFDGWSSGSMHYVTVYSVFETNGDLHLQLLAVSPLDDGSPDADANIKLFDSVPDIYNNTLDMVAFIVGDNYSSIQSTATKLHVQQVGCISHRFNLAVTKYLAEYEPLLAQVNTLMVKLCQVNKFAELTKTTSLHPIKQNRRDGVLALKCFSATAGFDPSSSLWTPSRS